LLGVSTVPVERDRTEEMVTQCIVGVLSNALAKPNSPPVNPECKEILKKSGRNERERRENNQLEVRHSQDPAETENRHAESMEKEQSQAEEESKKYVTGSDEKKLAHEQGKSIEEETGHHTPVQDERLHTEEQYYQETGREEENYHSEEEGKESKCCDEDVQHAILNKKSHSGGMSTDKFHDGNDLRPLGHWLLDEGLQSRYKQAHEGEEGKAEEERSEKYHQESKERVFSNQQEHEVADESEESEEEKQPYKPKHYHGKHRMGDSYEEKRGHSGEKAELTERSDTEEAHLWDQWNHYQKHHEESEQQHEKKSGYHARHVSEEVKEKRLSDQGSEKYRDSWQQSEKSSEENKRYHRSEESNEKWHEERRPRDGSHEARRHLSEGRTYFADENEEELDRHLSGRGRYHLGNNDVEGSQKASAQERKGQTRRRYSTEDGMDQQRYPSSTEEEVEKKHYSSDQVKNEEEERYAEREKYRTTASYSRLYPLLWWKKRDLQKRDDSRGEQLLKGKGEGRPALSEKSIFPEYNDYDRWEGKQTLSALNHKHTEKRNIGRMHRNYMGRQYNKMDQLAQLLNYRKKSAEFPKLYSSGEDLKKCPVTKNDRRSLSQRPLIEEEEKELENLATMDLELQNIVEKLNSLRRG
ncbi:SCG1 protein, partial [Pitta sordida]|nr:SCG1 protein [Pitta sordida]